MGNPSLNSDEAPTLLGLAHHYLCLTPAETVAYLGEPASRSLPGRPVGSAEYGAKQLLIAWLTISEQDYPLGVAKARNSVLQDLFDQLFVPHSRGKGHHQPGCRVDHFSLPELLTLTPSEAPAFIGLQAGAGQLLDPLVVEPQGRIRWIGVPS